MKQATNPLARHLSKLYAALVLICSLAGTCAQAQTADAAWASVLQQHGAAFAQLAKEESLHSGTTERKTVAGERIRRFRSLSAAMGAYLRTWVDDQKSVNFLRGAFRWGLYSELAAWPGDARICYRFCLSHNRRTDPAAVYLDAGQERPIDILAKEGLNRLPRQPIAHPSTAKIFVIRPGQIGWHGKPPIDVGPMSRGDVNPGEHTARELPPTIFLSKPDLQQKQDLERMQAEQDLQKVLRRVDTHDMATAHSAGLSLLSQAPNFQGRVSSTQADGLVVFAVNGTEKDAVFLAQRLIGFRQRMSALYFDSGLPGPVLTIYANLHNGVSSNAYKRAKAKDDEFLNNQQVQRAPMPDEVDVEARRLAQAVLGRNSDWEGYFSPLDNRLILLRGLRDARGNWYLGTPQHEMMHALVHQDFATAPRWLDEGLAALYEQTQNDRPLDNYRLAYLKEAQEKNLLPCLQSLFDSSSAAWSSDESLLYAAAARYFCLYLWEQSPQGASLAKFYRDLREKSLTSRENADQFSSVVLENALGQDVASIEAQWNLWLAERWNKMRKDTNLLNPGAASYIQLLLDNKKTSPGRTAP